MRVGVEGRGGGHTHTPRFARARAERGARVLRRPTRRRRAARGAAQSRSPAEHTRGLAQGGGWGRRVSEAAALVRALPQPPYLHRSSGALETLGPRPLDRPGELGVTAAAEKLRAADPAGVRPHPRSARSPRRRRSAVHHVKRLARGGPSATAPRPAPPRGGASGGHVVLCHARVFLARASARSAPDHHHHPLPSARSCNRLYSSALTRYTCSRCTCNE